jgi:[protein-PII] uridylyltransferase
MNAHIFTTTDGICLDIFYVTDYRGKPLSEAFRYDQLKKDFLDLSNNQRPVDYFLKRKRRHFKVTEERVKFKKTVIRIKNDVSPTHTILEIETVDRPWVLYTITSILRTESINIDLALISTKSYRVVDVFYITDLENNKVDDKSQVKRLRSILRKALSNIDLQNYLLSGTVKF